MIDTLKALVPHRSRGQERAPLADALQEHLAGGYTPFVIPAHKQGGALDRSTIEALGADAFRHDIAMLNGIDDIHQSKKLHEEAEQLCADLLGAKRCFYLVNGSTVAVQCAVLAVARPGEKLLVARNVHKSVISGLILGGIRPVFLEPEIDDERGLTHGVDPDLVERELAAHPDAQGVVVVSPSYYGVASDLAAIADICHRHSVPVVADDAWGAHFPFHPELPAGSIASGCDIAIGSFHKSLAGLQQAALMSVQGDLVDPTIVEYRVGLVETSSMSPLILASIDLSRRLMALHGEELLSRTLQLARAAREQVRGLPGLEVMGPEVLGRPGADDLDETKLVIDVSGLGISGYDACDWLRNERRVLVELADHRRVMAAVTIADDEQVVSTLVDALRDLSRQPHGNGTPAMPPSSELRTELAQLPRDAYFADAEQVKLEDAVGRIVAEKVTPYPPGVPVLVPGERIHRAHVEYLQTGVAIGMNVTDVADSQLETIRVVK